MAESKLKPGLMALATRIVEKAITDAPPNAVFELRYSSDLGPLRTKGGLTREKLRRLIKFVAQLLAAAFQVVVDYAVPPGAASGDVLESKESTRSELRPRARRTFPDKEEIH
ncbi:MAG TPA: hypothetical protein VK632_13030 [Verrucomicrobiae bacterium]|jgi:hypothetical protein|nr:hypothetical protein [Verrucomicrobiae bacterium]